MNNNDKTSAAIDAQAKIHHAYLLGLQLMVSTHRSGDEVEEWMFRLFRKQHLEKFLSSFTKLGLDHEPHAVACAKYHVLSNSIGGVPVEYMYESDKKAWVRFRYPRWMFDGPTLCGVPVGVSRGFLRGWYAHNGVSLGNPRLGYVCVSEDMTGEFGFCGYFKEYDHDLGDDERLQFAKGEMPPPYIEADQPAPPATEWNAERLQKANRNYAVEYIRNGLQTLSEVIGTAETIELAGRAARLIGLSYYSETAQMITAVDGDAADAARYLACMFGGMGDDAAVAESSTGTTAEISHKGLRLVRGTNADQRQLLLSCWRELWLGCVRSQRQIMTLDMEVTDDDGLLWTISKIT